MKNYPALFILLAAFVYFAGCKDDDNPTPTITDSPGKHEFSVLADGVKRWFIYHIPQNYAASQPAPVILAFHGGNGSMEEMYDTRDDLIQLSEERGFILVFPNGQDADDNRGPGTWNGVHCCGHAFVYQGGISDVKFVDVLLDSLENALSVDPLRIHALGFSNGGHIAQRLAAERANRIASVATMGANVGASSPQFPLTYPQATLPIAILLMHGMSDTNAPFAGGGSPGLSGYDFTSFTEGLHFWEMNAECMAPPDTMITVGGKGNITTYSYTGCMEDVIGITLQNVGHGWIDESFAGFDGTKAAIDFFESHPK